MKHTSLTDLVDEQLAQADSAPAGRASFTVHGGREHALRQTVVALLAGQSLAAHESPGEATLQVLRGSVRLTTEHEAWGGSTGDLVTIPPIRHALAALEDSAVLLTVVVTPTDPES